ncbi:MAG: SAM-dependent methyltransferase [Pseudomonadota bacterium]|nr:SAM-dependent methyltransferase [Pseudomonadota bacterium]
MKEIQNYLRQNKISLSRFISHCLYKKNEGFYQKNKIGNHFITSPEISQLFGECVSIFFLILLEKLNVKNFCELGPGNGTLMKDMIKSIGKVVKTNLNFYLYDKSSLLKSLQKKNLRSLSSEKIKISFLDKLELKKEPYFFVCNEFFDSLPINQYKKINSKWYEKRVIFDKKFKIINHELKDTFLSGYNDGDIIESSPLTELYMKRICKHIKRFGGGILIFDYGPFKKENIDTIQSIYKSKKCGVLDYPFESDITYHVDFQNLKKISSNFSLLNFGPITQKKFLYFYGINERVISLASKLKSKDIIKDLEQQFERLTSPSGLGNLIKCLFISNYKINLKAFGTN